MDHFILKHSTIILDFHLDQWFFPITQKIYGIAFNSKWNNFFNLFEYKGELFQGKFSKPVGYDGGPYLHYKSVLLRKKIKEMNIGFAIQHAVQHGGYDQNNNKIPTSWENYINVFFARSGDESQPAQDQDYKAGNGLGAFTFILEKNSNLFYYEHYFDDKSGVKTLNFGDGLIGINLKFSSFNLNFELVNTRNQSGNQHPLVLILIISMMFIFLGGLMTD